MSYYERNLPRWLPEGKHLFITWRLHGSLPVAVLKALREDKELLRGKRFVQFDRELDSAVFGPAWMNQPKIAMAVTDAISRVVQTGLCVAHAYVVMPNHVHLLVEPRVELKRITQTIKGASARSCNLLPGRTGPFWQEESFDHWVRSATSFERIRMYIERNPVSAGLVKTPVDWQWSSAFK